MKVEKRAVAVVLSLLAVTHIPWHIFQPNPTSPEKGPFTDYNLTPWLATTITKLKIFSFMVDPLDSPPSYQQKPPQNLSTRFENFRTNRLGFNYNDIVFLRHRSMVACTEYTII
jgi:hypothetical protein